MSKLMFCLLLVLGCSELNAQPVRLPKKPVVAPKSISESYSGQYVVESHDIILNRRLIDEVIVPARRSLSVRLDLPRQWRHKVVFKVDRGKAEQLAYADFFAVLEEEKLNFAVRCRIPSQNDLYEVRRAVALASIYTKVLARQSKFQPNQPLPVLPLWLIEGAVVHAEGNIDQWADVVRTALANQKAPTINTVMSWEDLDPDDSVHAAWQRAFCYYLFDAVSQVHVRNEFEKWLANADETNQFGSIEKLIPSEIAWRSHLADVSRRMQREVFSFGETESRLEAALVLELPNEETGVLDRKVRLEQLHREKDSNEVRQAIVRRVGDLTRLELRAHILWRDTIRFYRDGIRFLLQKDGKGRVSYAKSILKAQELAARAKKLYEAHVDYLNWIDFKYRFGIENDSPFQRYYEMRERLEELQDQSIDAYNRPALRLNRRLLKGEKN